MIRYEQKAKFRMILSVVLGVASLGVTIDRASAITPFDIIQAPLNAVLGRQQQSPPPTSRELHFGTDNLSSNNVNICALTCGPTAIPGITAPLGGRPTGTTAGMVSGAPIPPGAGLPPGAGIPPGARPLGAPGAIPPGAGLPPGAGIPPGARPFGAPGAIPPGAGAPVSNPNAAQRPNNPLLVLPPIQLPNPF